MTMLSDCHAQIPTGPGQPRLFPPRSWTILNDSSPLATLFATIPLPDTVEPLWPPIFQTSLPFDIGDIILSAAARTSEAIVIGARRYRGSMQLIIENLYVVEWPAIS